MKRLCAVVLCAVLSACPPESVCSAETCEGCCAGDKCRQGDTASNCGSDGYACATCDTGQVCTAERLCGGGGAGGGGGNACGTVTTSGRCVDNKTRQYCAVATGSAEPTLVTASCAAGESCSVSGGEARCALSGVCRPGDTRCQGTALETCNATGSAWQSQACTGQCSSSSLGAFCVPDVTTQSFSGTLAYQYRLPNAGLTDWATEFTQAPARQLLVLSLHNGAVLDTATTDDTGAYTINLPQTPAQNDVVAFIAAAGDQAGGIKYMVAKPGYDATGTAEVFSTPPAPEVWLWTMPSNAPLASAIINEAAGSPALRLYNALSAVYEATEAFYSVPGPKLVVWLELGVSWNCGACFHESSPSLPAGLANDSLWTSLGAQIWIGGGNDRSYYSDAVTAHELGHWVMSSYGTSPGEGGQHVIGAAVYPGMAWSEGFATWFSSAIRGNGIYYDKQGGGFFWLDIEAREHNGALPWPRPQANLGLKQLIYENEVSSILYSISQADANNTERILSALASPAMNTSPWGRGYTRHSWSSLDENGNPAGVQTTNDPRPMLADELDALLCAGLPAATVDAATQPTVHYPYPSNAPICP